MTLGFHVVPLLEREAAEIQPPEGDRVGAVALELELEALLVVRPRRRELAREPRELPEVVQRGAREPLVVELPAELDGFLEGRARAVEVARGARDDAEPDQVAGELAGLIGPAPELEALR